jgi:hypothetical protein
MIALADGIPKDCVRLHCCNPVRRRARQFTARISALNTSQFFTLQSSGLNHQPF